MKVQRNQSLKSLFCYVIKRYAYWNNGPGNITYSYSRGKYGNRCTLTIAYMYKIDESVTEPVLEIDVWLCNR